MRRFSVEKKQHSYIAVIEQGRAVYQNIRKFMTCILASNVAELVPFLLMVVLRIPPALVIMQILAIDLGTDILPAGFFSNPII